MDYRELLLKYIQHVELNAGTNWITHVMDILKREDVTPEEWAELEALALIAREME